MFRAQFGEDKYLSTWFPTGYIGTCVEVGADDGIKYSNTAFSRLVSQLGHLISSVVDIPVKTRTLNTLLTEANFPQKIDFISIDTENTELDVLKGLDLDFYDVTFLIIENNYNERKCIDYLATKGYTVFARLGVNDFFKKQ